MNVNEKIALRDGLIIVAVIGLVAFGSGFGTGRAISKPDAVASVAPVVDVAPVALFAPVPTPEVKESKSDPDNTMYRFTVGQKVQVINTPYSIFANCKATVLDANPYKEGPIYIVQLTSCPHLKKTTRRIHGGEEYFQPDYQ